MNWPYAEFEIPESIYRAWNACDQGADAESSWQHQFVEYSQQYPELAAEFSRRVGGELPKTWQQDVEQYIYALQDRPKNIASRKASQNTLEFLGKLLPEFVGGSADLSPSNLTMWSGSRALTKQDFSGNYIHYGVREFGMSAIMNGISLHRGLVPYGATFLMFMEYARNALRMAALMGQRVIHVYTHDSIGLGEDGPTHQPVEQMASLRTTPNMSLWRPCDQVEAAVAWKSAIERDDGPSALIFSRQNLTQQQRSRQQVANIAKGGYILRDCAGTPELIFIATGSEMELACLAYNILRADGIKTRVVSMPSTDKFDKQDSAYREAVLPSSVTARVAIEAGIADFWYKYVGLKGAVVGMTSFGESAPANELFEHFGFTLDKVLTVSKALLK